MATKKSAGKKRAVKQRGNSAKKTKSQPTGKPFEQGNQYRWKAGAPSPNPAGRPKVHTLSEHLRDRLKEQFPGKPDATYGRMVAEALVDRAINGDVAAIREIYDRVEGKPKQTIDVNVEERKREMVEDAIAQMVEEAQVSREEAIEQLTLVAPEMSKWIN